MVCEYNYSQFFFIMLSLIPASVFLSFWGVARFIWLPWVEKLNMEPEPEIPYIKKFIITDEDVECLNETSDFKFLKHKTLSEETPSGKVFFRYNHENEGFEYWSDSLIPYKELETVARKYVKKFSCVDLYIDRLEMIQEAFEKKLDLEEKVKKIQEERVQKKEDVFASFKTYNNGDGKITNTTRIVAAEKANKYSRRGKFKEAPIFQKKEKKGKVNVSWKDWFELSKEDAQQMLTGPHF